MDDKDSDAMDDKDSDAMDDKDSDAMDDKDSDAMDDKDDDAMKDGESVLSEECLPGGVLDDAAIISSCSIEASQLVEGFSFDAMLNLLAVFPIEGVGGDAMGVIELSGRASPPDRFEFKVSMGPEGEMIEIRGVVIGTDDYYTQDPESGQWFKGAPADSDSFSVLPLLEMLLPTDDVGVTLSETIDLDDGDKAYVLLYDQPDQGSGMEGLGLPGGDLTRVVGADDFLSREVRVGVEGLDNEVRDILTIRYHGYDEVHHIEPPVEYFTLPDIPDDASDEPFVIGGMDALTGVAESYGNPLLQAKLMAVEEINAAGGIDGRELMLIVEDSKCAAQDAITAYNKLTDVDGVRIILGTTCSGAMLGAAPLAENDGVVLLSASATSPDIAFAGDYIFRTAINDLLLGVDIGNTLWVDGVRRIATITEATDYAEGARRTAVSRFEELGGSVVGAERYSSDVIDFRSQLAKLLDEAPDAILLAAQGEASGGAIVKQARELGYDGPIYSEIVPVSPEALAIAGDAATDLKAIIPNPELASAAGREFLARFEARYDTVASLPWFQGSAYDGVYIAAECLRQTGDDQDADGFRDCLYGLTWSGAIGDGYSFDENGDVVGLSNVVVQVLPTAERTEENLGYRVLGPAPTP